MREFQNDAGVFYFGWQRDVLLLSNPLPYFVESVRADDAHPQEVVRGPEPARGNVALDWS